MERQLPSPYAATLVRFPEEGRPRLRYVYSPYGERPGSRVVVAAGGELERWLICEVEEVTASEVRVAPSHRPRRRAER